MIKEIILPDLGEGIDGAEVSEVSVSVGDIVTTEQTILVLESDKASMEIPAEVKGVISEILVSTGDELKPGHLLMKVETTEGVIDLEKTPPPQVEPDPELVEPSPTTPQEAVSFTNASSSGGTFASPGVRRLARELGINLQTIKGSGQKGRITKDDLNGYIKLQMAMSSGITPKLKKEVDFSQWGDIEVQKLTKIKRITGERLQQAWQAIPHVTQFDEADITALDSYRKKLKKKVRQKE
jgi:pyruvate dehydrogenase E2 component (dihydrolipoamide acetyltransferase)